MKNSRKCPKCGSPDIRCCNSARSLIPTGGLGFSFAKVDRYMCTACGYTEEWIADESELQKVREHYR